MRTTTLSNYPGEFNRSEAIEKLLRRIVNNNDQAETDVLPAMETGLTYGDTILFHPYLENEKSFKIQNIFPGHVRTKFSSDNYDEVDYVIVVQVLSRRQIEYKYGVDVPPTKSENVDTSAIWEGFQLDDENYAVVYHYYDAGVRVVKSGNTILDKAVHNLPRIPFTIIPAYREGFKGWGTSYLKDIIPIQKEHNEAISDEATIEKIFAEPKVVIRNATQKDIDNIKQMWKSGVIASRTNLEVAPFEFSGTLFPIEQRIQKIEDRFYRISGLGPAVFGLPPGSINTGASLTVQYAPTLQAAQIVWTSWKPRLLSMLRFFLETLEAKGGTNKEYGVPYKEIIRGNYDVELKTPFKLPRDEAVNISNELNKYQQGIQSKTTTMTNLGVKSPEDELALRAWEDFNPILSPDKFMQYQSVMVQTEQQIQALRTPAQPAMPQPGMTPPVAAEVGGRMQAERAASAALAGTPPPERARPRVPARGTITPE